MLKQMYDFLKGAAALVQKAQKNEETFKKLSEADHTHEENLQQVNDILRQIIVEINSDRQRMEFDKQIADRDREILLLRLDAALRNDTRALPPAPDVQMASAEYEARIAALEQEIAELKQRVETLEAANAKKRRG